MGLASCARLPGALWLGKGRRAQWWLMPAVPLSRAVMPGEGLASKLRQPKLRCGEGRLCWSRLARSSLAAAASGAHRCQILVLGNAAGSAVLCVCARFISYPRGKRAVEGTGEAHLSSPSSQEPLRGRANVPALSRHRAELQIPSPAAPAPGPAGLEHITLLAVGFLGPPTLSLFLSFSAAGWCHTGIAERQQHFPKAHGLALLPVLVSRGAVLEAFPTLSPGLCVHGGKGLVVGAPGRE